MNTGGGKKRKRRKEISGAPWIFLVAVTAGKYSIDQLGVDGQLIFVINAPNGNAEYGFRSAGRSLWSDQFRFVLLQTAVQASRYNTYGVDSEEWRWINIGACS